jgi:asparagine synthase (glutamine-hydrolysing)
VSGIFGLVNLDGAPVDPADVDAMRAAMAHWGPDGSSTLVDGAAGFGQCLLHNTPEALHERLPRRVGPGWLFTAEARIDNRDELCDFFHVPSAERPTTPDSELMWLAYQKWGEESPEHLLGDWSFAVWKPEERRLFLARDLLGRTSVFVCRHQQWLAFASDIRALLALPRVPRELDDIHLAATLTAWHPERSRRTPFAAIDRMSSGGALSAAHGVVTTRMWWRPSFVSPGTETPAAWRDLCLDALDQAVVARLRSIRPVAATLSAGLDSGAVVTIAANHLEEQGRPLLALTAVPLHATQDTPLRFANEGPLAGRLVAGRRLVGHTLVDAAGVSPIEGLRRMLAIHASAQHGSENLYWLSAIFDHVRESRCGVLLTAQGGNLTLSWEGRRRASLPVALVHRIYAELPDWARPLLGTAIVRRRQAGALAAPRVGEPWRGFSVIRSEWARELRLLERMLDGGHDPWFIGLGVRHPASAAALGDEVGGGFGAANGAAAGCEVRDPLLDVRVVNAALSVPMEHWAGELGRDFFRQMMTGRLPDPVRLSTARGRQAADLVPRLQSETVALNAILSDFHKDAAVAARLDLAYLRQLADHVVGEPGLADQRLSATPLTRGLGSGLFLLARAGGQNAGQ